MGSCEIFWVSWLMRSASVDPHPLRSGGAPPPAGIAQDRHAASMAAMRRQRQVLASPELSKGCLLSTPSLQQDIRRIPIPDPCFLCSARFDRNTQSFRGLTHALVQTQQPDADYRGSRDEKRCEMDGFVEEPCQYCTRLRVEIHRVPRSSSSNWATILRRSPRLRGSEG